MKNLLQFLRTTLAGGLLFLVPVVVLVIILGKALVVAHKLGAPLADSGEVYGMSPDRVSPVEAPPAAALTCLQRLGAGSRALLHRIAVPLAARH